MANKFIRYELKNGAEYASVCLPMRVDGSVSGKMFLPEYGRDVLLSHGNDVFHLNGNDVFPDYGKQFFQ